MTWENIKKGTLFTIYIILAALMYNALSWEPSGVTIGGFTFMYMYLLGMGIIGIAFLAFLVDPQVPRVWLLTKYSLWICMPFFLNLFISLIVWIVVGSDPNVIIRGTFFSVYQILAIMVAASTLYLFGDKGIKYNLIALVLASCITMVSSMLEGGAAEFFSEFGTLIVSGAMETGPLMGNMEMTGHTYAFGMYILYFLLFNKNSKRDILALAVAALFFVMEFKRSALLALIVALMAGLVLRVVRDGGRKVLINLGGLLLVIVGFVYIWMIKSGIYDVLMDLLGIDTSGRSVMYANAAPFYSFSPFFLGQGLGYVTKMIQTGEMYLGILGSLIGDIHNDFLRQFIEQGFWGYLLWLLAMFVARVRLFLSRSTTLGVLAFTISVFLYITFFSENMYFLFYGNIPMAVLMMGHHLEEQVEKERELNTWM